MWTTFKILCNIRLIAETGFLPYGVLWSFDNLIIPYGLLWYQNDLHALWGKFRIILILS